MKKCYSYDFKARCWFKLQRWLGGGLEAFLEKIGSFFFLLLPRGSGVSPPPPPPPPENHYFFVTIGLICKNAHRSNHLCFQFPAFQDFCNSRRRWRTERRPLRPRRIRQKLRANSYKQQRLSGVGKLEDAQQLRDLWSCHFRHKDFSSTLRRRNQTKAKL